MRNPPKSGRKSPGASGDATPQNPPAKNLVAVDRVQLAESFRRIARQSAEAARLNSQIADAANAVADKIAQANPPATNRKGAVQS